MVAGNVADIRFGRQTAGQGTALASLAATDYGMYYAGGNISPSRTDSQFEETTGAQMRSDNFVSDVHVEGDWEVYVPPKALGALLYGVLGAKSSSAGPDPYVHTFTSATSLPWWTFFRSIGGLLFERFVDCKIDRLTIHGESNQPLRATAHILGLKTQFRTAAEANPAIETTNRLLYFDAVGALKLEGTAVPSIRSFDIVIDRHCEVVPGDALGGIDIVEGLFTIDVTLNKLFLATSLYNRFWYGGASPSNNADASTSMLTLAGSPAGIEFKFTRVAAAPGPERSLTIALPQLQVAAPYDLQPDVSGAPYIETLSLRAVAPASTAISAVINNSQATYA